MPESARRSADQAPSGSALHRGEEVAAFGPGQLAAAMAAYDGLIGECRARLWLKETAERLMRSAWLSALVLLACALIHRFFTPVAASIALAVCALPGMVVLADGLTRRRPSRLRAAMAADECFGGKSLLTAAAEVAQRGVPGSAAAALLLRRAEQAAAGWRPQLRDQPALRPARRALAAPLVVLLACLFVLLLPGAPPAPAERAAVVASSANVPAQQSPATATAPASSAAVERALRRNADASIRGGAGAPDAAPADSSEHKAADGSRPAGAQARSTVVSAAQAAVPEQAAPVALEPHSPGTGAAAQRRDAGQAARSPDRIRRADIARSHDQTGQMVGGAQAPLATARLSAQRTGMPGVIVTEPAPADHQPAFPIAMRAYAARYFDILSGHRDE